jgi:cyclomaltodextrinase / maltogenic alpha-amylase / neopullulanase
VIGLLAVLALSDPFAPRPVSFTHIPPAETQTVAVVGAFNHWDRAAFPLQKQPDGKTWKGTFPIAPGVYPYLFVENGNKWVKDPLAPPFPDANGNVNGKLVVLALDYDERPASPKDDHVTASALRHRPGPEDTVRLNGTRARVKLRTRRDDVQGVTVIYGRAAELPGPIPGGSSEMELVARDELYDTWAGEIVFLPSGPTPYHFAFWTKGFRIYGPKGLGRGERFQQEFANYPLPNPPAWLQDAVFYQIFPERFANGDPGNDGPGAAPWGAKPTAKNRMGGDLAGIRQRLAHLRELGVSALYLNPVFEALSNHAYDTVRYDRVDPRLGTNEELKALVADLRKSGIRTVLDAVFNHSSPEFFAFRDVVGKGQASAYREWYFLSGFPVRVEEGQKHYKTFAGVPTMPKLNQDHPACRDYFLEIGEAWVRESGAAGWRLDVADEVSQDFWRAFRKRVKAADPEALILGEVWGNASEYLQGDQHDSVMNYRWRKAVLDFLAYRTADAEAFERELLLIRADYPDALQNNLFNLLGSHDTERVRTIFGKDRARERLAVVLQFAYPGVPSVYYGDEIGMEGGRDPDCRRCMEWDRSKWDLELFSLYKSLIALRKENEPLRRGGYRTVGADAKSGLFHFERAHGGQKIQVAILAEDGETTLEVPASAKLLLGREANREGDRWRLGPFGYAIFSLPGRK